MAEVAKMWAPIEFNAPDLRQRQTLSTEVCPADQFWRFLNPGVCYEGTCNNRFCVSRKITPGQSVICSMGFGKHRPNEDYCYDQIVCPACKQPFHPERFIFQNCSAKINFCIKGERPDMASISEDRPFKSRAFGKMGQKVLYTMLVMEVDDPGVHPDIDELESFSNSLCSTTVGTPSPFASSSSGSLNSNTLEDLFRMMSLSSDSLSPPPTQPFNLPPPRTHDNPATMNPSMIRYCQDSISNRFQCGRRVVDTMEKLRNGSLRVEALPTMRVFQWNSSWYTEDNRRLWAFKNANLKCVPVKIKSFTSVDHRKLTTANHGVSIRMRGH